MSDRTSHGSDPGAPDPKERFSSRVGDYARHRPGYPREIIGYLSERWGLRPATVIADVGSGTGIFSALLLANGNQVYAVEPNDEMRRAAEERLSANPRFVSVAAPAEATTLPDRSVDMITAAQSFHWFDAAAARREFQRILKQGGPVVLVWNARLTDSTPFLRDYEQFLRRFASDYLRVNHRTVEENRLGAFFAPNDFSLESYPNEQLLDVDGLRGRVMSSSYMPNAESAIYPKMNAELERLFARHENSGTVRIEYRTNVYSGTLGTPPRATPGGGARHVG